MSNKSLNISERVESKEKKVETLPLIVEGKAEQALIAYNRAPKTNKPKKLDNFSAMLLGLKPGVLAESKTFTLYPDPFQIIDPTPPPGPPGSQPTPIRFTLWEMRTLRLTYVRATDNQTGIVTCFITFSMYQTASGWVLRDGGRLHILSKTSDDGLLEDWDTGLLDTNCTYKKALKTYKKEFRPDWYDLAVKDDAKHQIYVSQSTWNRC